jgi:SAM-dependent methyltransferase
VSDNLDLQAASPPPPLFTVIEGFRCYAPELAFANADYPEAGFAVTAAIEAGSFWCRSRNRVLHDLIERFTDRGRRLTMLEIGCGIGGVVAELRRLGHLQLTAAEVSIEGLRFARTRFPDVEFIQLDATAIPFHADFDIIGAFDVLEHIEADQRVMRGVHDALRPEGLFVITVPQYPWMWSELDETVRHKRRYRRSELVGKLRQAGFDVLFCSSFVTALFPAMLASRVLTRRKRAGRSDREKFAEQVTFSPLVNRVCDAIMRFDEAALRAGISLPFGGSLVAVARKT